MIRYEKQYISNLEKIMTKGTVGLNARTGIKTYRLPSTQISVNLEAEFPILMSKKVNWQTAVKEILWIMQKQSNRISDLGAHIWDSWADAEGTIGKAYGYQVGKRVVRNGKEYESQVHYVLETLKEDPSNRQCVIDLWNVDDINEMNLVPCCYSSVWNIIDGKLNCMLVQRSADYPVGVPFDTTQYAALTYMFARHLGVKPGILTHVMADSHIYLNQVAGVKKQLEQYQVLSEHNYRRTAQLPKFVIKPYVDNFFDMTLDDFMVENYEPMPAIKFEVAV